MTISIEPAALTRFFIAILLLLTSAHFFGDLFGKLRMPRVVGEIFGGLLLGPSGMGHVFPEFYQSVFLQQGQLLAAIYWLGLVLLMFSSGFEIDRDFGRADQKTIAALVAGTTLIPLGFGWLSTEFFDLKALIGPAGNVVSLKLIITVGLAITSIPVLSKIFMDLGIIRTPFARICLATATIHDVVLWVFVSIAAGIVSSDSLSLSAISLHVFISIVFFTGALVIVPAFVRAVGRQRLGALVMGSEAVVVTLILFLFAAAASLLEVNLVFGAFLAGIVINLAKNAGFQEAKKQIKGFSMTLFIPVYFAIVGLKLDLGRHFDPLFFLMFLLFALAVQTAAVMATCRLLRFDALTSFNFAVALNDRGGPCIVLATLAHDLGIINDNFFATLVLLAIVTSLTAGSWLRYVLKNRWPLMGGVA